MLFRVTIALIITSRRALCADILVAVMPQGRSHAGSFVPLLEELVRHNHNVTMYMESYQKALVFGGGIKQWYINITEHPSPFRSGKDYDRSLWWDRYEITKMRVPFEYSSRSCSYVMDEHRDEFMRLVQYPWDLVLTDSLFSACGYALATLSPANHVVMHSTDVEASLSVNKGYGRHYLLEPSFLMDFRNPVFDIRKFAHRLSTIYDWLSMWFMFAVQANSDMRRAVTPVLSNFDYSHYYATASMAFCDMPMELYLPIATNNELFTYGAYCQTWKPLTGELLKFISDPSSKGTILMAFGTILDWMRAPPEKREAFAEALNQLTDYRIIWAYNGPQLTLGGHVKVMQWVPQTDILNDNRTKLFITHGGLKSLKEAACATVPTLFMPIFGEQVRNSWLAKHHGFGNIINKVAITTDYLLALISDMLQNPSYKQNAQRLRSLYGDSMIPAVQEAAFKFDRLLKYEGRFPDYFYTRSTSFTYVRYLSLDLFLVIPILLFVALIH